VVYFVTHIKTTQRIVDVVNVYCRSMCVFVLIFSSSIRIASAHFVKLFVSSSVISDFYFCSFEFSLLS
jgi:hypothetical protein